MTHTPCYVCYSQSSTPCILHKSPQFEQDGVLITMKISQFCLNKKTFNGAFDSEDVMICITLLNNMYSFSRNPQEKNLNVYLYTFSTVYIRPVYTQKRLFFHLKIMLWRLGAMAYLLFLLRIDIGHTLRVQYVHTGFLKIFCMPLQRTKAEKMEQ